MKPSDENRSNTRAISSRFRLNNSKNFLAISRTNFVTVAGGGHRQQGHGQGTGNASGGDGVTRYTPLTGAAESYDTHLTFDMYRVVNRGHALPWVLLSPPVADRVLFLIVWFTDSSRAIAYNGKFTYNPFCL
jgi:hypothetical protein